ncbi:MAG: hypothetical protein IH988_06600 [Planctomycetes bacterium]|nr:hypothetical protein [Planctomycetota bacterium]
MVARVAGALLGLLAFSITVFTGLWVNNPIDTTLSRALWALCIFCGIGLVLGTAAQASINEQIRARRSQRLDEPASPEGDTVAAESAQGDESRPVGIETVSE